MANIFQVSDPQQDILDQYFSNVRKTRENDREYQRKADADWATNALNVATAYARNGDYSRMEQLIRQFGDDPRFAAQFGSVDAYNMPMDAQEQAGDDVARLQSRIATGGPSLERSLLGTGSRMSDDAQATQQVYDYRGQAEGNAAMDRKTGASLTANQSATLEQNQFNANREFKLKDFIEHGKLDNDTRKTNSDIGRNNTLNGLTKAETERVNETIKQLKNPKAPTPKGLDPNHPLVQELELAKAAYLQATGAEVNPQNYKKAETSKIAKDRKAEYDRVRDKVLKAIQNGELGIRPSQPQPNLPPGPMPGEKVY